MSDPQLLDPSDVSDLVDRRRQVGDYLLRIWNLGYAQLDDMQHPFLAVYHLLMGAGFSLWRAAFLVRGTRDQGVMNKEARLFLDRLVWDNAIAYAQDRNSGAWTAGYYLNNAYYRLIEAGLLMDDEALRDEQSRAERFVGSQRSVTDAVPDLRNGWAQAMDHAEKLLTRLEAVAGS
jgi:hypothetical protein